MEVFKQIYSFRSLIYCEKTMVQRKKNFGIMEKLWCDTKNYATLIYYGKNYSTVEKTIVLWKKSMAL